MIVIKILMFILSLSLLVFIHELGHYIAARIFGVKVEKFYIFFDAWGFSLLKFKIGETQFGIGWIPFGGYCKISGMIDESMDTEQMKQPAKPDEFRSKPAWQRLIIMTGGVIMNVILAIIVYIGFSYTQGDNYIANDDLKYGYYFNDLGHEAGFRDGDKVLTVDGEHIENYLNVYKKILIGAVPPVEVMRDGATMTVSVPEEMIEKMLTDPTFMRPRIPFVIGDTMAGMPATQAGILPGDSLVAIDSVQTIFFDQYSRIFGERKGKTAEITVARDSAGVEVLRTMQVTISDEGTIGVYPMSPAHFFPIRHISYNFWQAIPAGVRKTGTEISDYWDQVKMIFKPKTGAYKSLGGFVTIGSIFPDTWDWSAFWSITAFLSIILAVMNILPIPALDGGHVLFLLWEVVTGRKPSDKFMEWATMIGLLLVVALVLFANANDIYRLFTK
ncbi:RIP metalloprotease RseP [Alistipes sp. OttesenSCG-928-B03]|nr:RIP metalloprotease RseP [Alistipes sp. OttesenSCG-928-B03]